MVGRVDCESTGDAGTGFGGYAVVSCGQATVRDAIVTKIKIDGL